MRTFLATIFSLVLTAQLLCSTQIVHARILGERMLNSGNTTPLHFTSPQSSEPAAITFANVLEHVEEIPEAAWNKIQTEIGNNQAPIVPIKLYVGPNTQTTNAQILALLQREMQLMHGFKQPRRLIALAYNGIDVAWAETKWRKVVKAAKLKVDPSSYLGALRAGCTKGAECWGGMTMEVPNSGTLIAFYGVQEPYWSVEQQQIGPISQVNHEYTHAVQFSQWIGISKFLSAAMHRVVPCWWAEGQANAIGIGVWAAEVATYRSNRDYNVTRPVNRGEPSPSLKMFDKASLTKFLKQDPRTCYAPGSNGDYQFGYSVGYAAVETLIAIGGARATIAVLSRTAAGDSWAAAFKKVYGVKWAVARDILAAVLEAEYRVRPLRNQ
jgi:hypothetical protein